MASTTDVREWLRQQGEDVPSRGPVKADQRARYDAAHPDDGGVITAGDFPEPPGAPDQDPAAGPATSASERRPRPRQAAQPRGLSGLADRVRKAASPGGKPTAGRARRPAGRHARVPVGGFIEDFWSDLAWMAAPMPPLQRVLQAQAPFAGVIMEDAVRGTFADRLLQPAARNVQAVKAINGTLGPPAYVLGIMLNGRRIPLPLLDEDGKEVIDPATGKPLVRWDYDARTKMMFMGLRYSLMHMGQVTADQLAQVEARAEERIARGHEVDRMIAWIFGMPDPPETSAEEDAIRRGQAMMRPAAADAGTGPSPGRGSADEWPGLGPHTPGPPPRPPESNPYPEPPGGPHLYPPPPGMTDEGADPGR